MAITKKAAVPKKAATRARAIVRPVRPPGSTHRQIQFYYSTYDAVNAAQAHVLTPVNGGTGLPGGGGPPHANLIAAIEDGRYVVEINIRPASRT